MVSHDDEQRSAEVSEEEFFKDSAAPSFLESHKQAAEEFITAQVSAGRRIALITSGGTTVPLENQTVRFIDNFSAGTRGATSAEYFLDAGYAVIFFHRKFSLLPYSRHYSHTTNCFLDFMSELPSGGVAVRDEYQASMRKMLRKWTAVKAENRLLMLSFVTVSEYLWVLRELSLLLKPAGPSAVLYLAAAVSDFFIPRGRLSEHKIQSTGAAQNGADDEAQGEKLMVNLDPVPKFLKRLVDGWAPASMVVSFKLETDPSLLLSKAKKSLHRYSHQLVIGNLLSTRAWEVVFVRPDAEEKWIRIPADQLVKNALSQPVAAPKSVDRQADAAPEIESFIVPEVAQLHTKHISSHTEQN